MTILFISVLILFGIFLIAMEILIVPGFIVGVLGGVFVIMGIGWTWQVYGATAGTIVGLSSLLLTALTIWSALSTGFWKYFSLQGQLKGRANEIDTDSIKAGDHGAALSSLRPMGTIRVNGKRFEASSETGMIPVNYPIIVVRIEDNKIIVRADV
jgi:membrane-bound serine protease (ClpP class)